MGRPVSKTTKFILGLPKSLSAKEVLKKAKASGHKTSEGNIYRVRRLHGAKKTTSSAAPTAGAPSKPNLSSKSDFIRGFSANTPAKEVVAKAKAAGIKLDIQYVYKLRSRSKPVRRTVAVAKPAQVTIARTKTNGVHSNAEDLLRAVAAELGLGHAMEILQHERAQVRAVLGN